MIHEHEYNEVWESKMNFEPQPQPTKQKKDSQTFNIEVSGAVLELLKQQSKRRGKSCEKIILENLSKNL